MPYIKESDRQHLDVCIENMISCLNKENHALNSEDLLAIAGDINYTFSRILGGLVKPVSYGKIAIITGVLENIKQEFYRRVASPYEDQKIIQNGDIREYKLLE